MYKTKTDMQYESKDIPKFQEDVCKKTCIMKGKCIKERENNDRWFLMCPHYFYWKLNIPYSFVHENAMKEHETNKNDNAGSTLRVEKNTARRRD